MGYFLCYNEQVPNKKKDVIHVKKFTKLVAALGATLAIAVTPLTSVFAASYTTNTEFRLGANEGDSRRTTNKYIILHETANPTATGRNEATFMKRNWRNAYTSHIVGDGMVYEVGQKGYMQYGGASYEANISSYAQIELQHTNDKALFEKNYKVYVSLARDLAKEAGIPLTLDTPYPQNGIKSHLWLTQNIAGDHTDPYAYLSKMGVSKQKLANDLKNGVDGGHVTPDPTPSKPDTSGKKSNEVIAGEVIAGLWGNGSTRVSKLKAAGYDPVAIQKIVDQKLGKGNSTPAPAPQGVKFYAEKATFTPYQARNARSSAVYPANNVTGVVPAGYGINYTAAGKDSQGNVWVRYQAYSGTRYMIVRQNGVAAGTFR